MAEVVDASGNYPDADNSGCCMAGIFSIVGSSPTKATNNLTKGEL